MNKKNALLAGSMMLMLLASTAYIYAAAEEDANVQPIERTYRIKGTLVLGIGVAVDTSDDSLHRSHFRFVIEKVTEDTNQYTVKRGKLIINDEGSPVRYAAIPDTWHIEVADDNSAFEGRGEVEDAEGNNYSMTISGELLRETSEGKLYSMKGTFEGNGEAYELYHIGGVIEKRHIDAAEAAS